jgi:hypothetical protein
MTAGRRFAPVGYTKRPIKPARRSDSALVVSELAENRRVKVAEASFLLPARTISAKRIGRVPAQK